MIELGKILDALLAVPEWPWFVADDPANDCSAHTDSGLALVDTGRTEDWPIARLCEWNTAGFIASSPLWLAEMLVGIVEERTVRRALESHLDYTNRGILESCQEVVLRGFNLNPTKWAELRKRMQK